MGPREIAEGLSEGMKKALTIGFAGPFSDQSDAGMWREWPDIVFQVGRGWSFRNTIQPILARDLAERSDDGMLRLNALGLAVRQILLEKE